MVITVKFSQHRDDTMMLDTKDLLFVAIRAGGGAMALKSLANVFELDEVGAKHVMNAWGKGND